jgi:hypothetical protein
MLHDPNNSDTIPEELWLMSQTEEVETPYADLLAEFDSANKALFAILHTLSKGEGKSIEELDVYLNETGVAAAQSFARLAMVIVEDPGLTHDETATQIAKLFIMAQQERLAFLRTFAPDADYAENDEEALAAAFGSSLDEIDEDDIEEYLENSFGVVLAFEIDAAEAYMPNNKNEERRERREARKALILKSLGDVARVGVGVTIALVANRYIREK